MTPAQQALFDATSTGSYPPGTTAADLVQCKEADGTTALHWAAIRGNYPANTTTQDLLNCADKSGVTALHKAAYYAHLLPDTTIADLVKANTGGGWSALSWAFNSGQLPPNTTPEILRQTKSHYNNTAWDDLIEFSVTYPDKAINLPPSLFANQTKKAIAIVDAAISLNPERKPAAAVWLGHILAHSSPKPTVQTL